MGILFAGGHGIIALLQLIRVVLAWDITLNGIPIPLFASGMVAFVRIE